MDRGAARRVVVLEASPLQCATWRMLLEDRYGDLVEVETYTDVREGLAALGPDIHLLLLDLDLTGVSCSATFEAACSAGVDAKRVIVTSNRPAQQLHEECDATGPLAVIEKSEPEQQAAFLMILDSVMKRAPARPAAEPAPPAR